MVAASKIMRWFLMMAFAAAAGATEAFTPGTIGRDPDFHQDTLLRRDFSTPRQRMSVRGEGTLENSGPAALLEEDSMSNDNGNNQASDGPSESAGLSQVSDPSESTGLSQELKALESTQQMKEALESSILRDMAKTPQMTQKAEEQKKADEAARSSHHKEELTKSIEQDIMSKLETNDQKGGMPASATEVSDAAGLYESQLGILQALKQRLTSSGRVVKEAADAEEAKIEDRVLQKMDQKLASNQPMIVSSVLEEGQKGLAKDLANAIQKNRDDEMKILNSSLSAIREEARQAESEYRAHTQEDIQQSMHHFGSNITSLLQGFIRATQEKSLEQKDEREDDDYDDDYDDDDDRNSRDDDDYDDSKDLSKRKSYSSQPSSQQSKASYSQSDTQYDVPGTSNTQNEPMTRMQGKSARADHHRHHHYSSDDFEADALAQAADTEATALGSKLPEKEQRLGGSTPVLAETLDLGEHKEDAKGKVHTDDDFGLKEAEDTVSKEVLKSLSVQKTWPGTERQRHHFHRHKHHHQDDYDDDDY